MMRELGGVLGIALTVAAFAAAGSYTSATTFLDGFTPAIATTSGFAVLGAFIGTQLPGRTGTAGEPRPTAVATALAEGDLVTPTPSLAAETDAADR